MNSKAKNLKEAADMTPDLKGWYRNGLQAIKREHKKNKLITAQKESHVEGSIDIDKATENLYRNENRWDYVIECRKELHFVEVHHANTKHGKGEVEEKLEWLRGWLANKATPIDGLPFPKRFHWVASGRVDIKNNSGMKIAPTSVQRKKVGLWPVSSLQL